jgi:4-hydroxybenzoate polyprenyltransferase
MNVAVRTSAPSRALVFVGERFSPAIYSPLIVAFVACGSVASATATGRVVSVSAASVAAVVVTLAFIRMRLLDEVKDQAIDRLGRPWRPLPRGLVTVRELQVSAWLALAVMTAATALLGTTAFAIYLAVVAFLVLAGADFAAGEVLRTRRLVYAIAHSPAVPLLLLFVWFAQPGAIIDARLGWLLVVAWGSSLGAEIGRKTVAPDEERPHVETYSELVGRPQAALLTAVALATGAAATAGYAVSSGMPALVAAAPLAGAAAILGSWPWLRRSPGRTIELWSGAVALVVLLVPPALTLAR